MTKAQPDQHKIVAYLKSIADPKRAEGAKRFFKSGEGEYGEGDQFLGIANPAVHQAVKRFKPLDLEVCEALLESEFHEVRFFALAMMVELYRPKRSALKEQVVASYLANTQFINNWDLVDCSAYKILGNYLIERDRSQLFDLARSESLWERRIAIVSNYAFIKQNDFETTLSLAEILKHDSEDLIHKAVGWMLKEVGKRDAQVLRRFIQTHHQDLPRTLLRTAIEKLPANERAAFLANKV